MRKFARKLISMYIRICRVLFGVNRNKVLFESFSGKSYSDNPKPVSEALRALDPNMDIVWAIADPTSKKGIVPDNVRVIDRNSKWTYYKELATCGCYVTNVVLPKLPKGKKQRFIQLWHGDRGFKKIMLDSRATFTPEQVEGYCDLAVTGSKYGERMFASAFHYTGEILKTGIPRNDCLIAQDANVISAVRNALGVGNGTNVLLYAPTLRDNSFEKKEKQSIQGIDLLKTLSCLEQKCGSEWVCLVRAHPSMLGLCGMGENDKIVDVSSYEDMADLLLVSDVLITDYSSSAGDFVLMNKPVILFQDDKKDYIESSRELYFDMDSTPFYIAETQDELETIIQNLTDDAVRENCQAILSFYGAYESGKAAEDVAKRIIEYSKS